MSLIIISYACLSSRIMPSGRMAMDTVHNERRSYPRYRVHTYALSVNADILAEIVDISNCGMSCRYLTSNNKSLPDITEMGILNCESGNFVQNLSCRMVRSSQETVSDTLPMTVSIIFILKFHDLASEQRKQLDQFINSACSISVPCCCCA